MILLFISIFWLAVCVDSISADPLITVEVHVGSTALLPCNLNKVFTQTPHVRWYADDKVVFERNIDVTNAGPGYEGRVDVPVDELRKGNCSLVLKDVRFTDHAFYKSFKVELVEETDTSKAKEINRVQLNVFQTVFSHVGSTAVLSCDWRNPSIQKPHVEWSIGDEVVFERLGKESYQGEGYEGRVDVSEEELLKGNCSLVMKNVTVTDEDLYSSYMVVINNNILVQKIKLSVREKPERKDDTSEAGLVNLKFIILIIPIMSFVLICPVIFILRKYRTKLLKCSYRRSRSQNIRNVNVLL